jgi:hypothetical protein
MKSPVKLFILALIFGLVGCEKQVDNPAVEEYINQLKTNSYTSTELPDFQPSDIPALLAYRNETTVITNFPHNSISSFWAPECKLGMYVLWTIESIRAKEIDSKELIGSFPSKNPVLVLTTSKELKTVTDDNSLKEAADAYYYWWRAIYIFTDKMKTNPLEDTDFRWL